MLVLIPSSSGQFLTMQIQTTRQHRKSRCAVTFGLCNELQSRVRFALGVNDELVAISFNESEINIECDSRDACLRLYSNSFQLVGCADLLGASLIVLRVNGAIAKKIPVALMLQMGRGNRVSQ